MSGGEATDKIDISPPVRNVFHLGDFKTIVDWEDWEGLLEIESHIVWTGTWSYNIITISSYISPL